MFLSLLFLFFTFFIYFFFIFINSIRISYFARNEKFIFYSTASSSANRETKRNWEHNRQTRTSRLIYYVSVAHPQRIQRDARSTGKTEFNVQIFEGTNNDYPVSKGRRRVSSIFRADALKG